MGRYVSKMSMYMINDGTASITGAGMDIKMNAMREAASNADDPSVKIMSIVVIESITNRSGRAIEMNRYMTSDGELAANVYGTEAAKRITYGRSEGAIVLDIVLFTIVLIRSCIAVTRMTINHGRKTFSIERARMNSGTMRMATTEMIRRAIADWSTERMLAWVAWKGRVIVPNYSRHYEAEDLRGTATSLIGARRRLRRDVNQRHRDGNGTNSGPIASRNIESGSAFGHPVGRKFNNLGR